MKVKHFVNNNTWKGQKATCFQFHMKDLNHVRNAIIGIGACHSYQKIDSEKSYVEDLAHAQKMIDDGAIDFYVDSQNGKDVDYWLKENPNLARNLEVYNKWSKWTAEEWVEKHGWEKDEVYWFSITKDSTYTYQLILKEGDWIAYIPSQINGLGDGAAFWNVGNDCKLPYTEEWEEVV